MKILETKLSYESAELDVILFDSQDIVTASGSDGIISGGNLGGNMDDGSWDVN